MEEHQFGRVGKFFAALERSLSWLDSLAKAIGVGLFVALVALNFNALAAGVRGLAEKLPHLVKVSAFGVNVELDPAAIEANVTDGPAATEWLRANWTQAQTRNAVKGLQELDKRELARLVDIGQQTLKDQCRYANSDVDGLYQFAVDKSLDAKKLAALTPRPEVVERLRAEGKSVPLECYDIKLSAPGLDVRTAVVRSLGSSLSAAAGGKSASPAPPTTVALPAK